MLAGDLVREARRRAGLSQRRLAVLAGTTQAAIARLEAGHVDAPLDRVTHLLAACGFDLDVRVVPLDEDAWALARQTLGLDADARVDRVERMLEFHAAGRDARGEKSVPNVDAVAIVRVLRAHGVHFIVIGGYGAILHGAPHVTDDLDVVPDAGTASLQRLSAALDELDARIRTASEPTGVPFDHDARSLAEVRVWNLVTKHGNLDLAFEPSGTSGYEDLRRDAVTIEVRGEGIPVASLADIIRSKEAAGRDRDRASLPLLRKILAERQPPRS